MATGKMKVLKSSYAIRMEPRDPDLPYNHIITEDEVERVQEKRQHMNMCGNHDCTHVVALLQYLGTSEKSWGMLGSRTLVDDHMMTLRELHRRSTSGDPVKARQLAMLQSWLAVWMRYCLLVWSQA